MIHQTELEIFTSVRYDGLLTSSEENQEFIPLSIRPSPFYMLENHRQRLLEAASYFKLTTVTSFLQNITDFHAELRKAVETGKAAESPSRVRIAFSKEGKITVVVGPTSPLLLSSLFPPSFPPGDLAHTPSSLKPVTTPWALYLDLQPCLSSSPYSIYKTNRRHHYEEARSRALPVESPLSANVEVIMYNSVGDITEGSLTSLYFYRNREWVTPAVECGCQRGTTRRWALKNGLCREGVIPKDSIALGETLWVSNGVRGFAVGVVQQPEVQQPEFVE